MARATFGLTGKIQNYLGYALKNEVLVGQLNHTSALIDANEFISGEPTTAATPTTPTPADTTASEPIEIPRNIDFTLNSSDKKDLLRQINHRELRRSDNHKRWCCQDEQLKDGYARWIGNIRWHI